MNEKEEKEGGKKNEGAREKRNARKGEKNKRSSSSIVGIVAVGS